MSNLIPSLETFAKVRSFNYQSTFVWNVVLMGAGVVLGDGGDRRWLGHSRSDLLLLLSERMS
jgi:hypothetical protein